MGASGMDRLDTLEVYRDQGYMVVEDLLSPQACDRMIAAARRLPEASLPDMPVAMQPHLHESIFYDVLCYQPITGRIEEALGAEIVGLATHFYYCIPGCSGLMRHQDNFCVEAPVEHFASCWIPLVDVNDRNGCLRVYPGTHRTGILPVRTLAKDELRDTFRNMGEETVIAGDAPGVNLAVKRGTGIFLHGSVVHESLRNQSSDFRYAFLGSYAKRGVPFRPGNTAKRYAIDLQTRTAL